MNQSIRAFVATEYESWIGYKLGAVKDYVNTIISL